MPIPTSKLQEAKRPLEERIAAFLQEHKDQAYTLLEVWQGVEGLDPQVSALAWLMAPKSARDAHLEPYRQAIERLEAEKRVTSATYQGSEYFGWAGRS